MDRVVSAGIEPVRSALEVSAGVAWVAVSQDSGDVAFSGASPLGTSSVGSGVVSSGMGSSCDPGAGIAISTVAGGPWRASPSAAAEVDPG